MPPTTPGHILDFWFGRALANPAEAQTHSRRWFRRDPEFDAAIRERFGDAPFAAARGDWDAWLADPAGALAWVIALDQFPRNLYRDDARAFAFDPHAVRGALLAIDAGFDRQVHALQAVFFYLPLEHAEDARLQERSVALFEALQRRADAIPAALYASFTDYAHRHRDVIARFGRFPHRNAVLGRIPTPEEIAFLANGGAGFGP